MSKSSICNSIRKIFLALLLPVGAVFSEVVSVMLSKPLINAFPDGSAVTPNSFSSAIVNKRVPPAWPFFSVSGNYQMAGYAIIFIGEDSSTAELFLAKKQKAPKRGEGSVVPDNNPRGESKEEVARLFLYDPRMHTERQLIIMALSTRISPTVKRAIEKDQFFSKVLGRRLGSEWDGMLPEGMEDISPEARTERLPNVWKSMVTEMLRKDLLETWEGLTPGQRTEELSGAWRKMSPQEKGKIFLEVLEKFEDEEELLRTLQKYFPKKNKTITLDEVRKLQSKGWQKIPWYTVEEDKNIWPKIQEKVSPKMQEEKLTQKWRDITAEDLGKKLEACKSEWIGKWEEKFSLAMEEAKSVCDTKQDTCKVESAEAYNILEFLRLKPDVKIHLHIYVQANPCQNRGPDNGGFSCVDYYNALAKCFPKLDLHVYFPARDMRLNKDFFRKDNKYATEGLVTFLKKEVELLPPPFGFTDGVLTCRDTRYEDVGQLVTDKNIDLLVAKVNNKLQELAGGTEVVAPKFEELFNAVHKPRDTTNLKYHAIDVARETLSYIDVAIGSRSSPATP